MTEKTTPDPVGDGNTVDAETFEQQINELEALVESLESGELELAESLDRFRRGIELSRRCQAVLAQAQKTVDELSLDPTQSDEKSD